MRLLSSAPPLEVCPHGTGEIRLEEIILNGNKHKKSKKIRSAYSFSNRGTLYGIRGIDNKLLLLMMIIRVLLPPPFCSAPWQYNTVYSYICDFFREESVGTIG